MPVLKAENVEAAMLEGGPCNVDEDVAAEEDTKNITDNSFLRCRTCCGIFMPLLL